MTTPPPDARPRSVDIAFWLLIGGSVLLLAGGMLALTTTFPAVRELLDPSVSDDMVRQIVGFRRIAGVVNVVAGLLMGWLTGKLRRRRDPRFRRAVMVLALAIGVVVAMLSVVSGYALVLIAVLPILVGAMLLARPAATNWFAGEQRDPADG